MTGEKHVELAGGDEPEKRNPLEAHAAFFAVELPSVRQAMEYPGLNSLTIVLPPAPTEHDAWRRAIAGDLARAYAPKRFNIAAGAKGEALDKVCEYLRDAPGVTGHYVQAHD